MYRSIPFPLSSDFVKMWYWCIFFIEDHIYKFKSHKCHHKIIIMSGKLFLAQSLHQWINDITCWMQWLLHLWLVYVIYNKSIKVASSKYDAIIQKHTYTHSLFIIVQLHIKTMFLWPKWTERTWHKVSDLPTRNKNCSAGTDCSICCWNNVRTTLK